MFINYGSFLIIGLFLLYRQQLATEGMLFSGRLRERKRERERGEM